MTDLHGRRVAILATHGFEFSELDTPRRRLAAAGAAVSVVSPESGEIRGWDKTDWGDSVPVDEALNTADPDAFDALVLPGGQINPDVLRAQPEAVAFVKAFADAEKPLAAICHAPWLLIEAGVAKGRRMTSFKSVKTDVANAGADWVDEEAVRDGALLTSRNPGDLDAFCREAADMIAAAPARA